MRAVAWAMRRPGLRNVQELQIVFQSSKLQRNLKNIAVRSFILTGAPHWQMEGSLRPQPGCDLLPGAPAGPDGPVRLHRRERAWDHDRGHAVRSSALSLPAGVLGLRACSCCARRRELRGARGRPAERAVGAGWGT